MLDYADKNCLRIPFDVSGTDSISYIRLIGKSIFTCQASPCSILTLHLSGFEPFNTLGIGVFSKGTIWCCFVGYLFKSYSSMCAEFSTVNEGIYLLRYFRTVTAVNFPYNYQQFMYSLFDFNCTRPWLCMGSICSTWYSSSSLFRGVSCCPLFPLAGTIPWIPTVG
jgi:hypothetical protein